MQAVVGSVHEVYRRQRFLDEVNAGYEDLRRDAPSWEAWTAEGALWDQTLSDGLAAKPKPSH
ncbi:MAG TPA: toxin-antitoxin system protein [Vicinamibacteria bacterium]|nr:toxin-antitoxin system protein [Vicinamibacteria bacterium]